MQTIPNVVSSSAKAETGGIYHGAREAVPMIVALIEMVHPQDPKGVLIAKDNSTAHGILTSTMQAKLLKEYKKSLIQTYITVEESTHTSYQR